jgi:heat shock protein HtpX
MDLVRAPAPRKYGSPCAGYAPVPHNWASADRTAQELATLFMIGMAAVLSLCEQAAADTGGPSPQAIAERLRRVAGSGREKAQALVRQLGAWRLAAPERHPRFAHLPALCARAGLTPQPEIYLYQSPALNAFALGDRAGSAILVSEALVARLDTREVTAVLAHEIGHILNGDGRLLALAAELNQMVGSAVVATMQKAFSGRAGMRSGRPNAALINLLVMVLAPFASALLQHGLSRSREYGADRLAANLMGQPNWLVDALRTMSAASAGGRSALPSPVDSVGMLMRSHPDAGERIDRLTALVQAPRQGC